MIATNKYLVLWKKSAESIARAEVNSDRKVRIHLFTDQPEQARIWWLEQNTEIELKTYRIPNYVWPDATLLRYEIISKCAEFLTEDVLIYLDSDMLVDREFLSTLFPMQWRNGIALVKHPGFYHPRGAVGLIERLKNPYLYFQDLKFFKYLKNGMGAWETNPMSSAYVDRRNRSCYVHGAIWMGMNQEFKIMISLLEETSRGDRLKGIVPIWHDESHLNWYSATHSVTLLDPRYSWYSEYKFLRHLSPFVESMNKDKMHFVRENGNDFNV